MNDPVVNDDFGARRRLLKLIDSFDTAMLVTRSLRGELRARPMAIADHGRDGRLFFATRAEDEKLTEILRSDHVAITMQGGHRFLSITGVARINTDLVLADELWSPMMRVWFPDGPRDTQLTVIEIVPSYAEYWDRGSAKGLEFYLAAGKALLNRTVPDDGALSGHAKLDLN